MQAGIVYEDDYSSYAEGSNIAASPNWNATWLSSDTTQQNLFVGGAGGTATIDLQVAKSQYRAIAQSGFSITGSEVATIQTQFQYTHNGQGQPSAFNQNFFGLMVTSQPQWWNGSNFEFGMANRGTALGNTLPSAPWVENWGDHGSIGVDDTGGTQSTSNMLDMVMTITADATSGNYFAQVTYGGMTSSLMNTGIAAGTTIYAGYSVGWDNSGGAKSALTNIDRVTMDNFRISTVPEPSSAIVLAAARLGLVSIRRRKRG